MKNEYKSFMARKPYLISTYTEVYHGISN